MHWRLAALLMLELGCQLVVIHAIDSTLLAATSGMFTIGSGDSDYERLNRLLLVHWNSGCFLQALSGNSAAAPRFVWCRDYPFPY